MSIDLNKYNPFENTFSDFTYLNFKLELDEFKVLDLKTTEIFKTEELNGVLYMTLLVDGKFFTYLTPYTKKNYKVKILPDNKDISPYSETDCAKHAVYGEVVTIEPNQEEKNQLVILSFKNITEEEKEKLNFIRSKQSVLLALPRYRSKKEAYFRTIEKYRYDKVPDFVDLSSFEDIEKGENIMANPSFDPFIVKDSFLDFETPRFISDFIKNILYSNFRYLSLQQRLEIVINLNELMGFEELLKDKKDIRRMKLLSKFKPQQIKIREARQVIKKRRNERYIYNCLDLSSLRKNELMELKKFVKDFLRNFKR